MILPLSTIIRDAKKAPGPKWHLNSDIVTAITKNLQQWMVHDVLFAKRCVIVDVALNQGSPIVYDVYICRRMP